MNIRRAQPSESEELTALALSAKAVWGYSPRQLAAWSTDLRISSESLASRPTFVAADSGHILGVVQVDCQVLPWHIEHLWVSPSVSRRGIGTALAKHVVAFAAAHGQSELHVDSDPNAERFYLRLGARKVGAIPAPIEGQPGRQRPQLILRTQNAA